MWEPLKLDRTWDARWNAAEAADAVLRADEQVLQARANLDTAIACVAHAAEQYASALSWCTSARTFESPHMPKIPEPPVVALGESQKHEPKENADGS